MEKERLGLVGLPYSQTHSAPQQVMNTLVYLFMSSCLSLQSSRIIDGCCHVQPDLSNLKNICTLPWLTYCKGGGGWFANIISATVRFSQIHYLFWYWIFLFIPYHEQAFSQGILGLRTLWCVRCPGLDAQPHTKKTKVAKISIVFVKSVVQNPCLCTGSFKCWEQSLQPDSGCHKGTYTLSCHGD